MSLPTIGMLQNHELGVCRSLGCFIHASATPNEKKPSPLKGTKINLDPNKGIASRARELPVWDAPQRPPDHQHTHYRVTVACWASSNPPPQPMFLQSPEWLSYPKRAQWSPSNAMYDFDLQISRNPLTDTDRPVATR